ncbi:MAG: hypothetical protein GQ564_21645 [Bacteroidales bacterium]|nr:hypothetical protein [Bacteroidales bacterium]
MAGDIPLKNNSNIGINMSNGVTESFIPLLNGEDVNLNLKIEFFYRTSSYTEYIS